MPSFRAKKRLLVVGSLVMGLSGIAAAAYPFHFPLEDQPQATASTETVSNYESPSSSITIPQDLLRKTLQGKPPEPKSKSATPVEKVVKAKSPRPVTVAPSITLVEMIGTNDHQIVVFRDPSGRTAIGSVGQIVFKATPMECQIKKLDMAGKRILVLFKGHEHWLCLNAPPKHEVRSKSAGVVDQ